MTRSIAVVLLSFILLLPPLAALGAADASKPAGKPNVLIILADDLGFSDIGCYGSEIATPNLDRLAGGGLRCTQFYNTARCWPTRSALLSGYYPQQIRMDPPRGPLPSWTRLLPQRLKPLGYRSYHSGKWHVYGAPKPVADGGFDHSYTLDDHDRNFYPKDHREDDRRLPPVAKDSGYYSTTAFADHAIRCLKEHAEKHAGQPFFSYLAFTVPHFPLHAPAEDIARYRDRYLAGWDEARQTRWQNLRKLGIVNCELSPLETDFTPRYYTPEVLKKLGPGEAQHPLPWSRLSDEQKRFQAAKMAVHAAMIDRMDREIGRVLDQVRAMGAWDNTLIAFLSDNGTDASIIVRGDGNDRAAAPGSGKSYLCLGPGWSSVGNTPFRRHKIWTHEGGIATPLILHWPAGLAARGELRHDVGHVVDLVPTVLDLVGGKAELPPGAPPLSGRSLVPALAKDGAIGPRTLYFHHEGNRALRVGDYKLVSAREDNSAWELYNLANDRGEQHNLAAAEPNRVQEMAARWQQLQEQHVRDAGQPPPGKPKPAKPKAKEKPQSCKPNVVFFLADDLGYMDVGANNPRTFYETPRIDRLAAEGMRFTAGYAACPVCSPTRASIITGKYPPRTGVTDYIGRNRPGKLLPAPNGDHLALEEVTLAEALRDGGHMNFFAGKWHLGTGEYSPGAQGFSRELLGKGQFYYPKSDAPLPNAKDDPKSTDRIADEAVRFIEANKDRPFFAYLPFLAVHIPVGAKQELVAKYQRKQPAAPPDAWGQEGGSKLRLVQNHPAYAAMLQQMDSAVGRVLDALDRNGLAERTIVVFMSDNGGLATAEGHPTSNLPLRAGKGWLYEGGIREPWIIRAPGVTKPGSVCDTPVISNDFYPTLLELVGLPLAPRQHQDGMSLVPLLKGNELKRGPLFWHYPHYGNQGGAPGGAVRDGDWKLIEWYEDGRRELYNLARDPGEKHDLLAQDPGKVRELQAKLAAWRQEVGAVMPTPNPDFDAGNGRRK